MCIAIVVPAGKILSGEILTNCYNANPDGMGMAYINDDGKVELSKGFLKIGEFVPAYKEKAVKYGATNAMLVHFRIATMGKVNPSNCHPFRIKNGALIHNGSLWWDRAGLDAEKSDTRLFCEQQYNNLQYDVVKEALPELTTALGYNKLAMLYDGGEYIRVGRWEEDEGIYYSNHGYQSWGAQFTRRYTGPSCDV